MRSLEVWVDRESNIWIDVEKAHKTTEAEKELVEVCPYCGSFTPLDVIVVDLIGGTQEFYYYCYECDNDFNRIFDLQEREDD